MYIALLWEIIHLKSISLTPHSRFSGSTMKSCFLNGRTWRNWTQWTKWPVTTGGNICIWPCWHSMLATFRNISVYLDSLLHPLYMIFRIDSFFIFIFGCVRREKMSFALKRNCDGKSRSICKIEYHINIEFLPNDKHILHLTSVTARNGFFSLCVLYA